MRTFKKVGFTAGLVLLASLAVIVPASYAQVTNQATEMTFNQPVRIPGQVLPAGTYWFTIPDNGFGLNNIVRIYNADGTKLISQLYARTTDKTGGFGEEVTVNGVHWPTGKLVLIFARGQNEGRNQGPPALLAWYYPGRTDGHAFVYSSRRQKGLDEEKHETVAINVGHTITVGRDMAAFG